MQESESEKAVGYYIYRIYARFLEKERGREEILVYWGFGMELQNLLPTSRWHNWDWGGFHKLFTFHTSNYFNLHPVKKKYIF